LCPWVPAFAGMNEKSFSYAGSHSPHRTHATPSFFCRLVDDVVYWNTSLFSGKT
jgi:hypothetical protein